MKFKTALALIFIATNSLFTLALGQSAYKCGSTYSDAPCPNGSVVTGIASATAEQKREAIANAKRDAQAADRMEKDRLKTEALANKNGGAFVPPTKVAPVAPDASTQTASGKKKKKKGPEYFTAQVPGEKKAKKKSSKKNAN